VKTQIKKLKTAVYKILSILSFVYVNGIRQQPALP